MVRDRSDTACLDASFLEAAVDALKGAELTAGQRLVLRERVLTVAAGPAPPLTETARGNAIPWQQAWSGVWIRVMRRDIRANVQFTVFRMEPGSTVPAHAHTKEEECLVLQGEVLIGSHRLCEGDYHLALAGAHHPDITSRTGSLLVVRSEIPHAA